MADAIDQTTDAVGTAEEVETVDTGDTQDTDFDSMGWEDGEEVSEPTEEITDDEAATESTETTEEEPEETVESEETDTSPEDSEPATEATDKAAQAAERQKQNQEAAARRVAEKQAREEAKLKAQNDQLDSAWSTAYDQAISAGFEESQARLLANQSMAAQQLTNDAYNNRVLQVTNKVTADLNSAVAAIPEFRSDNPVIQEAMLDAVDQFEAMHVIKDDNGDAINVTGDVLQFLQREADKVRKLTSLGKQQQQADKAQQKKRTMTPPSRTPAKPTVDPDLAAFDEAVARGY